MLSSEPTHTTMINGLGVLGQGVGGIEEQRRLCSASQSRCWFRRWSASRLTGKLKEGSTATDLVLTVTEALRKLGVVGEFVEFYGPGVSELPLADRATIASDGSQVRCYLRYLPCRCRDTSLPSSCRPHPKIQIALVEAYYREQGMFHTADASEAEYSATIALDLSTVEPSVAGPKRPQDRVLLSQAGPSFAKQLQLCSDPTRTATRSVGFFAGRVKVVHASLGGDLASSVGRAGHPRTPPLLSSRLPTSRSKAVTASILSPTSTTALS